MNRERVARWLDLCESGEIEKATGALRVGDAMCFLGVGCELHHRETGAGEWCPPEDPNDIMRGHKAYCVDDEPPADTLLPEAVAEWFDVDRLPSLDATTYGYYHNMAVTDLNDAGGLSLRDMARLAREQWLGEVAP